MIPTFQEAFEKLLDQYLPGFYDDVVSELELKLMALKEEGNPLDRTAD